MDVNNVRVESALRSTHLRGGPQRQVGHALARVDLAPRHRIKVPQLRSDGPGPRSPLKPGRIRGMARQGHTTSVKNWREN
eukprot:3358074-Pyramimonas_sp.AAC.1